MSQARLLEVPDTQTEWDAWSFAHRVSHQRIIQTLRRKGIADLQEYPVDPINFDFPENFLQANQQMHLAMNGVLKLQNSDLGAVDFTKRSQLEAWIWLHAQQHQAAEAAAESAPAAES